MKMYLIFSYHYDYMVNNRLKVPVYRALLLVTISGMIIGLLYLKSIHFWIKNVTDSTYIIPGSKCLCHAKYQLDIVKYIIDNC